MKARFTWPGNAPVTVFLLAAALLFSRDPNRLLQPELWGEDGLWIKQAYLSGWQTLLVPHTGYLQTISRLGGLMAVELSLIHAPAIFVALSFIIQIAPVAFLLSARGAAGLPSWPARLLMIAYYIGEPNSYEASLNLTNAMWHLAIVAFMILVFPKPRHRAGTVFDLAVLVLSGLSGPFVIINAALALWEARQKPEIMTRIYAAVTCGCALIQIGCLVFFARFSEPLGNGASVARLIHILDNQIFASGIIGAWLTTDLDSMGWWDSALTSTAVAVVGLFLTGAGFRLTNSLGRKFLAFAAAVFTASLYSPVISLDHHQWMHLQNPLNGSRYFVIVMLGWFVALLSIAVAAQAGWMKFAARGLILACFIGVISDWKMIPFYPTGYRAAMIAFEAAPAGTQMKFLENPTGWFFKLTKR